MKAGDMNIDQRISKVTALLGADLNLLNSIEQFIEKYHGKHIDPYDQLPEVARELLDQSIDQISQGIKKPHSEVIQDIKEKYNIGKA